MWKSKNFFKSVYYAARGFVYAFGSERNYKWYTLIGLIFLCLDIVFSVDILCYFTLFLCVSAIFSCECINTAIEHICDRMESGYDDDIKVIKDMAAGSIFCWSIFFFASQFYYIVIK